MKSARGLESPEVVCTRSRCLDCTSFLALALLMTGCPSAGQICVGDGCDEGDLGPACNGAEFADAADTTVEVFFDQAGYDHALADFDCLVRVDFDDVDASGPDPVAILAERYLDTHHVRLEGDGSQYVHTDFGLPDDFGDPPSAPNLFAPGPMAEGDDVGGFETRVTFERNGEPAGVAAFSVVFVDADRPGNGPSGITVTGDGGEELGESSGFSGSNGSHFFVGMVATDSEGRPGPAILQADIRNGSEWVGLDQQEDVALNDFTFLEPVAVSAR